MALKGILMFLTAIVVILITAFSATASPGANFTDPCYVESKGVSIVVGFEENVTELTTELKVGNACEGGNYVQWVEPLDLNVLGEVTDGEVVVSKDSVYVDSVARPDLDRPAVLVFPVSSYVDPIVLRDGSLCTTCNVTRSFRGLEVAVEGFSNYSLTSKQEFTVHSDTNPELKDKVYQVVDLGPSNRVDEFACIVEIFGQNAANQWVLVQTNPERAVQGKLLGNPDTNQPESLGYFPTKNGVANTYFRRANIYGYNDFEMVIRCTSNTSQLIYEESVTPVYSPAGRQMVSSGVWLTSGSNGFYVVAIAVGGLIVLWILVMVFKRSFGR
jgi:hypothetical protein